MKNLTLLLGLLLLAWSTAHADGIVNIQGWQAAYLFPSAVSVQVTVTDQVAVTVVKQLYRNTTGKPVAIQYGFPLAVNATVTSFEWQQNGATQKASLIGKPQDSIVVAPGGGGGGSNPLQEYLGESPFVFSFPDTLRPDSSLAVELTFMEFLKYNVGDVVYSYPLKKFSPHEKFAFSFSFGLTSQRAIESIESPSHAIAFNHKPTTATGGYETVAEQSNSDMVIRYRLSQKELGGYMLSTKPADDDGYFLFLAEPDPTTLPNQVLSKNFTFIIDVSGSMLGQKMQQAKDAAEYCIQHLNSKDRFNVIAFSHVTTRLSEKPLEATPDNMTSGVNFVRSLAANGGTNMQNALLEGLVQNMSDETANVIVFLTDGQAQLKQETIVEANKHNTRIFVFGVGTDVNQDVLRQLAVQNNGESEFLGADNVSQRIGGFYNKIRNPLLLQPSVAFTAGEVFETYPLVLPDIYVGEQLLMLGRYKNPGAAQAILRGMARGKQEQYTYDVAFTDNADVNPFIPKMWAKFKIDALISLMSGVARESNQWKEWRDEIIRLSLQYGITSPYTSFTKPHTGGDGGSGGGNGGGNGGGDGGSTTFVYEDESSGHVHMVSCYPNPCAHSTTIALHTPVGSVSTPVAVQIYDMRGILVRSAQLQPALLNGQFTFQWDATDDSGAVVANGKYMVVVHIGTHAYQCSVIVAR